MTNEDAIKQIEVLLDSAQRRVRRNVMIPDIIEALTMAIEALRKGGDEE